MLSMHSFIYIISQFPCNFTYGLATIFGENSMFTSFNKIFSSYGYGDTIVAWIIIIIFIVIIVINVGVNI